MRPIHSLKKERGRLALPRKRERNLLCQKIRLLLRRGKKKKEKIKRGEEEGKNQPHYSNRRKGGVKYPFLGRKRKKKNT